MVLIKILNAKVRNTMLAAACLCGVSDLALAQVTTETLQGTTIEATVNYDIRGTRDGEAFAEHLKRATKGSERNMMPSVLKFDLHVRYCFGLLEEPLFEHLVKIVHRTRSGASYASMLNLCEEPSADGSLWRSARQAVLQVSFGKRSALAQGPLRLARTARPARQAQDNSVSLPLIAPMPKPIEG